MPTIAEMFSAANALTPDEALELVLHSGLDREGLLRVMALGADQAWLYRDDPALARRAADCRALAWAALAAIVLELEPEPTPPAEMEPVAARGVVPFPVRGRPMRAA